MDDLIGSGFRLVTRVDVQKIPSSLCAVIRGWGGAIVKLEDVGVSRKVDDHVHCVVESDGLLSAWLQRHQAEAAVVRPDNYVFAVAREPSDFELIEAKMREHLLPIGA
jgi:hypothetical protein